jgi:heat shock protein HslJ
VLSDSDGKALLIFRPYTLTDISWKLTAYNSGSAVVSVETNKGDKATISFNNEGRIAGSTGVNNIMGNYTEGGSADGAGPSLEINPLAMTRRAALNEDAALFEKVYTELLERTASYRLSGNTLTLTDAAGTTLLVFAAE